MMTVKHLISGAVVTAAVSAALVLASAVGAQAQVFPTPTPIGPGPVNKPIYTQPSLPGFHLPSELWTHYGPQVKPHSYVYRNLPSCDTLFESGFYAELHDYGYAPTGDTAVHATRDPQLLALIPSASSVSCDFVNATTGGHIDITLAIHVNDVAVNARLDALGFAAPTGGGGRVKVFTDGHSERQYAPTGFGGWSLLSSSNNDPILASIENGAVGAFEDLNG